MDWKKFLFGNFDYEKTSQDNHAKTSLEIRGGLIPSMLFWSGIIVLILYLIFRQGGDYDLQILLYELRKSKGLTQRNLADKLGISETAYRQKEKGQRPFTQDEMFFLHSFFNKPLQEIFLPRQSPKRKHQEGQTFSKSIE